MPENKLHFSLCASAAALLLTDNFTFMLHILFKVLCLYIQYACLYSFNLGADAERGMSES